MKDSPAPIREKFEALRPLLNERARRLWAAVEARALGRGGVARVARATGLAESTVRRGLRELAAGPTAEWVGEADRVPEGSTDRDPGLAAALERLLEPLAPEDPIVPLRWTCRSAADLATELRAGGRNVSERTVSRLLRELGYRLQPSRHAPDWRQHPDRDAQFRYLARRVRAFQRGNQPVVAVDCRKNELVSRHRGGGPGRSATGRLERASALGFSGNDPGTAVSSGIRRILADVSWVRAGVDDDTAALAVQALRRLWRGIGEAAYPGASRLLVAAEGGGTAGSRLWNRELQGLADELGLRISVCHLPLATSKWTRLERGMSFHVTQDCRGRPLLSREIAVNLVGPAATKAGQAGKPGSGGNAHPSGRRVTDRAISRLALKRDRFDGDWNYHLSPRE